MSTDNHNAQKPAKITAFETFVSKLKSEAGKDFVSAQQIDQAIGQAVLLWLPDQDEKTLIDFFAGIEIAGGAALARKIERHPLRPAAVAPIVEDARMKAEADKQAKKDEAARAKEERDRKKLAELKAIYENQITAEVSEAAE
ncbi:hypothetical protein KTN05_15200 [Paracoccus sp. Z118]|uniref:hypothetical protein n=1 Tax=Paracoccus sp. Z118 TaxID=2851017 RepID=UPI001C2C7927|nr:hypothetical protein [Paracoccus sp. Z118]MBV0893160.1 hypothetical protein [Paracoccus sp. Z118]